VLRIVLVEPQEAGNVGAVARAMKNFGFDDLRVVGSHPQLLPVAGWWASGADDLVERIRFHATLQDAVADAHLTIATTSSRGRNVATDLTPQLVADTYRTLAPEQVLALVFGREDSGLTHEELMLCQRTASIPANRVYPTMNLAQAACVFCWEFSDIAPDASPRELPDAGLVERLHERAASLLLEVGFLQENNPDRIYDDLRTMAGRASLDAREVTILLGIIRQIEWKLGRGR